MSQELYPVDFNLNQILNVVAQMLGTDPSTPTEGQFWYNSATHSFMYRTNSANIDPLARSAHKGTQLAATISDFATAVQAVTIAQSQITNLVSDLAAKAPLANPALTGTPTAPTASAGTNTTQLATTAFVITEILAKIASLDVMQYKGAIDASSNPNYPAANAGDTYRISVTGKIGGGSGPNVEAGDMIICHTDSSASGNHATVGGNWDIIQINIDGAVTINGAQVLTNKTISALTNTITNIGAASIIADLITGQTEETSIASGDFILIYDVSASALRKMTRANFVAGITGGGVGKYSAAIGDGSTVSFTVNQATHGRAADDTNMVEVKDATSGEKVHPYIAVNPANGTVTITFSVAPTTNQYKVYIFG